MDINSIVLFVFIFFGLYIQLFLLITFFEENPTKPLDLDELPTVSITVPCFNEARTLSKTVNSLLALNYPKDKLKIVIINDGSTDNTEEVALSFKKFGVEVITQKNGGKYTALNRGIEISKSDLIGCLDADSEVHPDALMRMVPLFSEEKIVAVIPNMVVHEPKNILQLIQRVEYELGSFTRWVYGKLNALHVTPGPFSIFKREIFEKIGPFKHAYNTEDMEIACRIQSHGYRIVNCRNAYVYTITPPTLKKLHVQRVRWTYGFLKNVMDYRHLFFNKKYGNIAYLTLPFGCLSIVSALYIFGYFIYSILNSLYQHIYKWTIVGIDTPHLSLNFDWFYINTNTYTLLAGVAFSIGVIILFIGQKISTGKIRPSMDMLYFFVLYGFIAPVWVGKSVYNVVLAKKTPWR